MREVFGIIWIDNALGPLTLTKPDAASAISTAASMREKAGDKIRECYAVRVPGGSTAIERLD